MKRVLAATVATLLISTFGFAAQSDEEMIRARAQEFADNWNKHDATAMAYLWSADGDLINPFGRRASGLMEIQRMIADEHSKGLKSSTYTIANLKVHFLNPQLAIVDEDTEIAGVTNPDGTTATIKPHVTAVMTKGGGHWWFSSVRAFTYMQPPPPPAPK